jgi:hypothetical protein
MTCLTLHTFPEGKDYTVDTHIQGKQQKNNTFVFDRLNIPADEFISVHINNQIVAWWTQAKDIHTSIIGGTAEIQYTNGRITKLIITTK